MWTRKKTEMPSADRALPGREQAMPGLQPHAVTGRTIQPPFPDDLEQIVVGMGCFWGAERLFWQTDGVWTTAVGYAGGTTPNPSYEEVCSGMTGHTEVVLIVFDPLAVSLDALLKVFWEGHDPTQGMRQGNDVGTQYRSAIYATSEEQLSAVLASRDAYSKALADAGHPSDVTTEIKQLERFFYAEDYHQQYLWKIPNGYCGLAGTGVSCPIGSV
jgi:peptide-methionine (S)-S-oxide reductase